MIFCVAIRYEYNDLIIHTFFIHYMSFSRAHISTICKYMGVGFITGSISHGFFSGTRSVVTAGIGIIFFIIGTLLNDAKHTGILYVLYGVLFAIGMGSFSGGFAHFPDSPWRSVYIIPIGFVVSAVFYALLNGHTLGKSTIKYLAIGTPIVVAVSIGCLYVIQRFEILGHNEGAFDHHDDTPKKDGSISNTSRYDDNAKTATAIKNPPVSNMKAQENMTRAMNSNQMNHDNMDHSSMSMDDMANMLKGKSGDELDKAFLEGMIPHHQGAVDMAGYMVNAKHPELRSLAQEIIRSQENEIAQMKRWQQEWGYAASGVTASQVDSASSGAMNLPTMSNIPNIPNGSNSNSSNIPATQNPQPSGTPKSEGAMDHSGMNHDNHR
jgi:hypothetical protein